ncbi:transporter, putative [Plasmodium gallinaceum]|uniref:Transporter, putative n=1 Tax=Plasmodium gallinaceum TaxID=5849 RepID=A0A1J1GKU9_PLAGA|nr:transporter, putative [Plasmodium gallinaceum]CRG93006.1 transporter, putative [Plasmodium gallinaceum]
MVLNYEKNENNNVDLHNCNTMNIESINKEKDHEMIDYNNKNPFHKEVEMINKTIKLSNHDNEYDKKTIKKEVYNLNKLKEEKNNNNSNYKEKEISLVNVEIDTRNARHIYQQKLNSTQSTMNIEANPPNDNDDELINNVNNQMEILKKKNKQGVLNADEEGFDNSIYISDNLDDLSTSGKNYTFFQKLKMCFNYFGPGWIVAIAYLDPGNLCSNLNVGLIRSSDKNLEKDYTGYQLLWIMIYGHLLGFLFQVLSMKLGHVTGLDLASICYKEFNKKISFLLYIFVQIAIWGAHIQAIVGTVVAINLIFGISVKIAIFYTIIEALIYSILENKSVKLLENVLSLLIGLLAVCFFINVFMTSINFKELAISVVYPRIPQGKEIDALALLGSIISAHIFYLHTNLTAKKKAVISTTKKLKRYNILGTIESAGALFLSCLTNCIIVLTFAEVNIRTSDRRDQYNLFTAYEVMKKSFGKVSMYIWSFGLLSSGNNSSFMCEYATKSIFEGFLNKKVNTFFRVLFFRFFLFFVVYLFLLYDKYSIDQLTNFINVIQVLLLPLAIVPLYRFSIHKNVLGDFALKKCFKYIVLVIIIAIIISNLVLTVLDVTQKDTNISSLTLIVVFSIIYFYFILFFFNLPITKIYYQKNN